MKLKHLICLCLIISLQTNIMAQMDPVEKWFVSCFDGKLHEDEPRFSNLVKSYELYLISEGFLDSASSEEYFQTTRNALSKMMKGDQDLVSPEKSFVEYHNLDLKVYQRVLNECNAAMMQQEGFANSTIGKYMNKVNEMAVTDMDQSALFNYLFEILQPADFDLDYYRFNLFQIYDSYAEIKKFREGLVKLDDLNKELEKKLSEDRIMIINLDSEDRISVNDQIIELQELEALVRKHFKDKEYTAAFELVKGSNKSNGDFETIKKELNRIVRALRNEYANEIFGKPFEELEEKDKKMVELIYPINITEVKD